MARAERALVLALLATTLGACEERRIVAVRGGLAGMPGAQGPGAEEQRRAEAREDGPETERLEDPGAFALLEAQTRANAEARGTLDRATLRVTDEDGGVTLVSTAPRHVVSHLRLLLAEGNRELLYDELLSERTKGVYIAQGRDPHEAVEFLFENKRDVLKLLARIPMGEFTPGMYLKPVGPSAFRMEVTSRGDLVFTRLDIVWERGVCRLLLIS